MRVNVVALLLLLLLLLLVSGLRDSSSAAAATAAQLWAAANSEWALGRVNETLALLLQIERVDPDDSMLPMALGAVYQSKKDFERALAMYERALPRLSENADLHANIGQLFYHLKDMPRAIESYHRAIALDASVAPRIAHLVALAHHFNGDYHTAETYYELVQTKTAEYHFDFGVTLERLGKIVAANREYNRALALNASLPQAWLNVAALHQQHGQVRESIPSYLKVLELPQSWPQLRLMAMTNLGVAYEVTHDIVSALHWFDRALRYIDAALAPAEQVAPRTLVYVHVARAKKTACVWANHESEFDELLQLVLEHETSRGKPAALMPFDTLMHAMPSAVRKQIAAVHARQFVQPVRSQQPMPPLHLSITAPVPQLCVGYLSYDFTDHPTAHLLKGLFASSDRTRTRVVAFGYGKDDGSAVRREVVALVDAFEDMASHSTEQSIATIQRHGVHILMDAQVHTRGSRLGIIAARPAPIVVNYLVYPGTSGAPFVDYLITDRHVLPPELAASVSEKLVVLPYSYQVNAYDRRPSERTKLWAESAAPRARTDTGDTDASAFMFVNWNKPDKIEPSVFAMWMAILRRVPQSKLLLLDPMKADNASAHGTHSVTSREIKRNIALEAEAHGVLRSRIQFLPRIPKAEHLKRHNVHGLFVDTFIYGAHSTATDALYAGLPFLTLAGDSHASRVGVSLLANVGMDELVTFSRREYEDLAVRVATQTAYYTKLRSKLRTQALAHPLFQTPAYTKTLETSQRVMFDLHAAGRPPHHIVVRSSPHDDA